jgi:hypothetical protein
MKGRDSQHHQEKNMNSENTLQPVPTIVLSTESTDPDFNGDCDYAVVQLTPELVERVRRRVELARQAGDKDDDLCELQFLGGTEEFHDSGLPEACQNAVAVAKGDEAARQWLAGLEQDGHALVPPTVDLAACQPQRTEYDRMEVRCSPSSPNPRYEIAWSASPKHSDVCVTTRDLPLTTLEGYAGSKIADDRAAAAERLAEKAESAGLQPEDLDETVHELASSVAADVNNGGLEEQVRYLVEGLGAEHAEQQIDELIKERQKEGE